MFRTTARLIVFTAAVVACSEQQPVGPRPNAADGAVAATVPSAPQRVRWRFRLAGDYSIHSPGVASDGTVYVSMENGRLIAVAPNGTLRWVIPIGSCGLPCGSVSVAVDGTIYAAGVVPDPNGNGSTGAIFAITPTGAVKWVFNQTNQFIIGGPNIGPDGNIYAVADVSGIGLFSLTPQGQLRFSTGSFTDFGALGTDIAFGSGQLYFAFDMAGISGPALFGYTLNGAKRFEAPNAANNARPAVGPNGNIVIETFPGNVGLTLSAFSPAGALLWRDPFGAANTMEHPDVGPDNISYSVRNLSTLFALTANGIEQWRYRDTGIMFEPRVGPRNDLVFMGGRITYGAPGFFLAVHTNGTPLWRVNLPDEPGFSPYGQLVPMTRPVFTPDGNTAYMVTDVAGDGASTSPYSFLYAIDVSTGTGTPTNQKPVANFTTNCVPRTSGGGADCTVDGRSSTDPDGTIASYAWTATGRQPRTGPVVVYPYPIGSTPTISLTVTDNKGATNTKTQQITVGGSTPPTNQPPTANFTFNCITRPDGIGADCTFNGSSSTDSDGTIVTYAWTATGRPARSGVSVTYPYPRGNRPTISLTVTDDDGAANTKTVQVTIP
jgi:chitodextrinase